MNRAAAFRGQPLLLLGGLLAGWACLRVGMLQASWDEPLPPAPLSAPLEALASLRVVAGRAGRLSANAPRPARVPRTGMAPVSAAPFRRLMPAGRLGTFGVKTNPADTYSSSPRVRGVPGAAPLPAVAGPAAPPKRSGRLSADAWLLLRRGGAASVVAAGPTYGRGQAGAVVRYRLAPDGAGRPRAYLRVAVAIEGARERQFAAGLSFRPLRGVPMRVAAEARLSETALGASLDPAVYAVSELPPVKLPLGIRGEAYLQGGYAAGRHATAFVDGQVRVEKPLSRIGRAEIGVGGGAWGGAQKGAARFDVGPGVTAVFPLGEAYGRLAVDYRFRVAGDAAPASGPALTLSAGF